MGESFSSSLYIRRAVISADILVIAFHLTHGSVVRLCLVMGSPASVCWDMVLLHYFDF